MIRSVIFKRIFTYMLCHLAADRRLVFTLLGGNACRCGCFGGRCCARVPNPSDCPNDWSRHELG